MRPEPRGPWAPALLGALLAPLALPTAALAVDDGAWHGIAPPAGRYSHSALYDPLRDRMVVAIGNYADPLVALFDVWSLNFVDAAAVWRQIRPAGTGFGGPGGASGVYDSRRDRIIYPGATSMTTLDLAGAGAWDTEPVGGTPPEPRGWPGTVYDPLRDRFILFGGLVDDTTYLSDVWAVDLSGTPTWVEISTTGTPPPGRIEFSMIYDSVGDRLIVFGGRSDYGQVAHSDVWALSLAGTPTWTELTPPSGPSPAARGSASAMFDPVRNRMLVQGGSAPFFPPPDASVWALSLGPSPVWTSLSTSGPAPPLRAQHSMVYDSVRDRMLLYGGLRPEDSAYPSGDTHALDLSTATWSVFPVERPTPRHGAAAVYDAPRQRMLMFGGSMFGDTWELSLAGSQPWTQLAPSGAPPPPRVSHSAIVDPMRQRMIVFGGSGSGGNLNDLWSFDLVGAPSWAPLTALGTPPSPRNDHTAIYDPDGDRMIVFGGSGNDVWQLTLAEPATWSMIVPSGTAPTGRSNHSAIYDPVGARMLVYGGFGTQASTELWELTLGASPAWNKLTASGTPGSRAGHGAVYDAARRRMLLFGGSTLITNNSTWALSLSGPLEWTQLAPMGNRPMGRCEASLTFDAGNDRMIVYGGNMCSSFAPLVDLDHAYALTFGSPLAVGPGDVAAFGLRQSAPNPAAGDVTFSFSLTQAGSVQLAVFDLAGRRRAVPFQGERGAGDHHVRWSRSARNAAGLGPGVYFYELCVGDRRLARRMVITE